MSRLGSGTRIQYQKIFAQAILGKSVKKICGLSPYKLSFRGCFMIPSDFIVNILSCLEAKKLLLMESDNSCRIFYYHINVTALNWMSRDSCKMLYVDKNRCALSFIQAWNSWLRGISKRKTRHCKSLIRALVGRQFCYAAFFMHIVDWKNTAICNAKGCGHRLLWVNGGIWLNLNLWSK